MQKYIYFTLCSLDHGKTFEFSPRHHTEKIHNGQKIKSMIVRKLRDLLCGTMAGTRQDHTVQGRRRGKKMGIVAILRAFPQTREQTASALHKGAALGLTRGGHRGTGFAPVINPRQQVEH